MNRVIIVDLTGQTRQFRMHESAYDSLRAYLDQARARLGSDPDSAEVLDDLERSIGERIAVISGPDDRVITGADVSAVLAEVGTVDVGADAAPVGMSTGPSFTPGGRPRRRRLYRIKEGQQLAGVCKGIAVVSEVRVDWVRTIFVLATLVTAGFFLLIYVLLMFFLPVVDTEAEWMTRMQEAEAARGS